MSRLTPRTVMPRCQQTFRRLTEAQTVPGSGLARWKCSFCPEAEVYETIRSPDLLEYARQAQEFCVRDFGNPSDTGWPTLLLLGIRPECVREPNERRYDIYLQRDSDPYQLRLQIGHEIFHRVCSQGKVFHWTHEMLACLVSVRLLRRGGFEEYADQTEQDYQQRAKGLSHEEMTTTDRWSRGGTEVYTPNLYGRAYVTGLALQKAVGWNHLTRLTRFLTRNGTPDTHTWLGQLPTENLRSKATQIVGITTVKVGNEEC